MRPHDWKDQGEKFELRTWACGGCGTTVYSSKNPWDGPSGTVMADLSHGSIIELHQITEIASDCEDWEKTVTARGVLES